MKKISFVLSSFLVVALLAGCSVNDSQSQTPPPIAVIQTSTDPVVEGKLNIYRNDNDTAGFSVNYSNDFLVSSVNGPLGSLLTLQYPDSYQKGTNLIDAKIMASMNKIKGNTKCTSNATTGKPLTITKTVNGQVLYSDTWSSEGVAGQSRDNVLYSTIYGGTCFNLLFVADATNLTLLNKDSQKAVAYDKAKLLDIFNTVVETFKLYNKIGMDT